MNANGVVVHSNQLSRIGVNHQILKNGSSVLVRVIADKGNGQYTGSVAGVRVNLKSNHNLKIGSAFVATISQKSGIIIVTPKDTSVQAENFSLKTLNNDQILSFLKNLGVPVDKISVNLIQQLKQMEQKLDSSLINKLHNIAFKLKGKEKAASEILSMIAEKGLEATEEEILQLLDLLENEKDFNDAETDKGTKLLNQINRKPGAWFIFPFELLQIDNSEILGSGNIRLLFDKNESLKLLNTDCTAGSKRYLFSLMFTNKKLVKMKFNTGKVGPEKLIEEFRMKFPGVAIEWSEAELIEGSASCAEEFFTYEGIV